MFLLIFKKYQKVKNKYYFNNLDKMKKYNLAIKSDLKIFYNCQVKSNINNLLLLIK
jgi:hypothetical protein